MTRVITVGLGRNQTLDAAEAIITAHGGARIGPVTVLEDEIIEASIDSAEWNSIRAELEAAGYELD